MDYERRWPDVTATDGQARRALMERRITSPKNDGVAMVMCPKRGDLAPISLAYIKGAVRRRSVQCFDFNHELLKHFVPEYHQHFDYEAYCADIVPFMFSEPDFHAADAIRRAESNTRMNR
jgi:hypothetical protein